MHPLFVSEITKPLVCLRKTYDLYIRLVRNPLGSAHPEATLKACIEHGAPDDAIQAAKAEFHAHLAANRSAQAASSHDLVEDSELLSEDREMDSDSQGMTSEVYIDFCVIQVDKRNF